MRILFTFVGGHGHFEPLAGVARAAASAGHDVAFGCAPGMLGAVRAAGFEGFGLGASSELPAERIPLRPVDRAREDRDLRERFARRAARARVPLVRSLLADWQPDVLVCDETDFGAVVAAECVRLPHATVLVIAAGSFVRAEVVGEALRELRAAHGLPPDPELEMLRRYLVLSPFPPSYRDPDDPLPATAHAFRPAVADASASDGASAWPSEPVHRPRVYFTLGTVFNLESGDLLERVVRGLRDLPVDLLVTVGREIDPAELGPQPSNVRIERFVPQASVLPHCDLVVSHGGSGSVIGALAHGVPSVLIPLGADQPGNGTRSADLGVARVLDAMEVTPETVRAAASTVLGDPAYRERAGRVRDEMAALPGADHAVQLLERLAADPRPVYVDAGDAARSVTSTPRQKAK